MSIIYVISTIIILVVAFKINVWLGIAAIALLALYGIYSALPTIYEMNGNRAYAAGDYNASKMWYKKAYDTHRSKVRTRISYSAILLRTGDNDEAETILNAIIRAKGAKPDVKNRAKQQRCMVYYKQGRLDEAMEEAAELFENGYKNTAMYGMIGYFKLVRGDDIDETTKFCEEALEYNDDDRDIMDNLSICYYKKGEYDKAKELSDKIVEGNPTFIEAYFHGAQIAEKLGNYKTALEYLDKIPECTRSNMTTVSEEEIATLRSEVEKNLAK